MATNYWSRRERRNGAPPSKTYKRPEGLFPWGKREESVNGSVWIKMRPKKIIDQYTKGAGTAITEETNIKFQFLAPLSLNESILHHWEAYESVASRLAQKARSALKLKSEGKALYDATLNYLTSDAAAKDTGSSSEAGMIENAMRTAYALVPGSPIPKVKIDTPLYYANSDRRRLDLEFELFNEIKNDDPKPESYLLEPIQLLMKLSSPDLVNDGGIDIEFPYMWEVETYPQPWIKYTTCALVAVQPTWEAPYVQGFPIKCRLNLSFQDMSPLYRDTIEKGTIINVKNQEIKRFLATDLKTSQDTKKKVNQKSRIINASAGKASGATAIAEPIGA
jgi:hypothetical protein